MIPSLLIAILLSGSPEEADTPVVEAEVGAADTESNGSQKELRKEDDEAAISTDTKLDGKKPTLRLRRSRPKEGLDDSEKDPIRKIDPPEAEKAPEVPQRNIPAPGEMEREPSELDKELLGELGQVLEAANEEEDPLMAAGRRMREVEERLARLEAGDSTVELQDKILADLDELLKQRQNGRPPPKNQSQKKQQKNQQQQMAQQQQRQGAQQRENRQANDATDRAGPPRGGREEFGTPNEIKNVWGHLSELMREEMSQYAKEGFLEKYREMLEQYYSTIATRSSRSE